MCVHHSLCRRKEKNGLNIDSTQLPSLSLSLKLSLSLSNQRSSTTKGRGVGCTHNYLRTRGKDKKRGREGWSIGCGMADGILRPLSSIFFTCFAPIFHWSSSSVKQILAKHFEFHLFGWLEMSFNVWRQSMHKSNNCISLIFSFLFFVTTTDKVTKKIPVNQSVIHV